MDSLLYEWLALAVRWFHLVAGIAWIGNSFYFMWLDTQLAASPEQSEDVPGVLWMVHGGGFYRVEKRRIKSGQLPPVFHWFKWEATLTWMSGFALLALVYYVGRGLYLVDPSVMNISHGTAVAISLACIAGSWILYDGLWNMKFVGERPVLAVILSLLLLMGLVFLLCRLFSGRAAFIQLGAILGTLMVANVWVRILPAQRNMIAAAKQGETPDYSLGVRAKFRSTHNSYLTLPVLIAMISNHFPMLYSSSYRAVLLFLLFVFGALIRHLMLRGFAGIAGKATFILSLACLSGLMLLSHTRVPTPTPIQKGAASGPYTDEWAVQVITRRCLSCHSERPSDELFTLAPKDVKFDSLEQIRKWAPQIYRQTVEMRNMPLANRTQMTEQERHGLSQWFENLQKGF